MSEEKPGFHWVTLFKLIPAILVATVPRLACPCAMTAYGTFFTSLGLAFLMESIYLFPLTGMFLTFAVVSMGVGAQRRHGYGPFLVGFLIAIVLLTSKFVFANPTFVYGSVAALVGVSVWNAWPVTKKKVRFTPDGHVEVVEP